MPQIELLAAGRENGDTFMMQSPDPDIEAARKAGFDLNLININLALSPEERWRQHSLAFEMALELQNARPVRDSGLRSQLLRFRVAKT